MNLTTVHELSLEVAGPSEMMCISILSADLYFTKKLGDPRHTGAIAAVGRNSVPVGRKSVTLRATVLGEVLSDKHRSLQHLQREYNDSGQALEPVLTSSDRSHQLYQPNCLFGKVERNMHFPRGSYLLLYSHW